MTDSSTPGEPARPADDSTVQQELQHASVSARVPEKVGIGVFSTGVVVMHGVHEFVIDFLLSLAPPRRVAARLVLLPTVVPFFIAALEDNLHKYQQNFGPVPRMPPLVPSAEASSITDVYEQLKLPEDVMSGVYANAVMIVHSPAEFCLDFVTSFYPRSMLVSRVYLAAPHIPQLLDSLTKSWQQFQRRQPPPHAPGPTPAPRPSDEPSSN